MNKQAGEGTIIRKLREVKMYYLSMSQWVGKCGEIGYKSECESDCKDFDFRAGASFVLDAMKNY